MEDDDKMVALRTLLYRRRKQLGWSREQVAQQTARHGEGIDSRAVRYLEVEQRTTPDLRRLRAVALALRLSWDQVTEAMGLERW